MGTLTLNDGTVLLNSYALVSSGSLFVYAQADGMTFVSMCELFCDPAKTAHIVYTQVNGEDITFTGYEKITAIRDEGNGLFTAVLKEGEN